MRLIVGSPSEAAAPSASPPKLVQMTYIGKPETGFPIWVRTTRRSSLQGQVQVTTSETEVTELSTKPLAEELPQRDAKVALATARALGAMAGLGASPLGVVQTSRKRERPLVSLGLSVSSVSGGSASEHLVI